MILLPVLIILGTAGPYCAIYAVVMILASTAGIVRDLWRKNKSSQNVPLWKGKKGWDLRGIFAGIWHFFLQF